MLPSYNTTDFFQIPFPPCKFNLEYLHIIFMIRITKYLKTFIKEGSYNLNRQPFSHVFVNLSYYFIYTVKIPPTFSNFVFAFNDILTSIL